MPEETAAAETAAASETAAHPDEVPTLPQHSGFGSVWDSQLGVPADTSGPAAASPDIEGAATRWLERLRHPFSPPGASS